MESGQIHGNFQLYRKEEGPNFVLRYIFSSRNVRKYNGNQPTLKKKYDKTVKKIEKYTKYILAQVSDKSRYIAPLSNSIAIIIPMPFNIII